MISPQTFLRYLPFLGAIATGALLYQIILTDGWSLGSMITAVLLAGGLVLCLVSRPWCKIGAAAIGIAFAVVLAVAFGLPGIAGGLFIIIFYLVR